VNEPGLDLHALALSYNRHSRTWTPRNKSHVVAELIKANLGRSDRQLAKMALVSHTLVSSVRAKLEQAGDVATSCRVVDTRGRQQPRSRVKRAKQPSLLETVVATSPPVQTSEAIQKPTPTVAVNVADRRIEAALNAIIECARNGRAGLVGKSNPSAANIQAAIEKFQEILRIAQDGKTLRPPPPPPAEFQFNTTALRRALRLPPNDLASTARH
jgi:nitrogen regulatory protein PII